LKKRIWAGIIILILLSGFFATAIATYPAGALAALSDPWDAINQLFAKVAELERRIGIMERLLGIGQNQTDRMEYPYSATLASELEGKIEAKYNWGKQYSREWDEIKEEYGPKILDTIIWEIFIKNLSNQTIRKIYYDIFIRDENGTLLLDGGDIIVGIEGGSDRPTTYRTLRETPIYTEVPPGKTASFIGRAWIKDALEKAGIDPTTDPKLEVEIVINSIKFA